MAFYQGGSNYPSNYTDALFFSDYSRKCMWVMFPDGDGDPEPGHAHGLRLERRGARRSGDRAGRRLFYVDFDGGGIMAGQVRPRPPSPSREPDVGAAPLTVELRRHRLDPRAARRHADLRLGPRRRRRSSTIRPIRSRPTTYTTAGTYTGAPPGHGPARRLRHQRRRSRSRPATRRRPRSSTRRSSTLTWKVGDTISFSGHATDPQDGTLPPSALSWQVIIHHCPSNCHTHVVPDLRRCRERLLSGARPRVPVVPRDPADGDRQRTG